MDVPYDVSAAITQMLLEAHSLGLGGCWVHGPVATTRDAKKKYQNKFEKNEVKVTHDQCIHPHSTLTNTTSGI